MTPLSALSSSPVYPVSTAVSSITSGSSAIAGASSDSTVQRPGPTETGKPAGRPEGNGPAPAGSEGGERESAPQDRQSAPGSGATALDEQQLKELQQLKARDREVRAHEAAHQAVGGQYSGAVSYSFQRGPDGNQYAIGGEVSIDISPIQGDPQATIEKMRIVRAAAMAPAQPSAQDRAVAAQAMQLMLQAQSELASGQQRNDGAQADKAGVSANGDDEAGAVSQPGKGQAAESYRAVSGLVMAERSLIDAVA